MRIRRATKKDQFTQIANEVVRDYRLTWTARGLLTELLSYDETYVVNADQLSVRAKKVNPNAEGRDALREAVKELEKTGYIERKKTQNSRGHWATELVIHDRPLHWDIPVYVPKKRRSKAKSTGRTDDGISGTGSPSQPTPDSQSSVRPGVSLKPQVKPTTAFQSSVPTGDIPKTAGRTDDCISGANKEEQLNKEEQEKIKEKQKKDSIDASAHAPVREEQPQPEEGEKGGKDFSSSKDEEQNQNPRSQPQGEKPIVVSTSTNSAKPKAGKDEKEPSSASFAMIVGLQWERYRWSVSKKQARALALLVDEALEDGHNLLSLKRHLNNRLVRVTENPFSYLSNALVGDELPALVPDTPEEPQKPVSVDSGASFAPAGIPGYGSTKVDQGGRALPKEHVEMSNPEHRKKLLEDLRRRKGEPVSAGSAT